MKNREKYAEEIKNYKGENFCEDFIKPVVLEERSLFYCDCVDCSQCRMIQMLWLDEEYTEPEIDWSQVKVNTPILVKDYDEQKWKKRHFAKCVDGNVFAWCYGKTSYSVSSDECVSEWKYAKLAEV